MLRRLGGVQLDTISVLARSHELVAYARHGAIRRERIEREYWGKGSTTFEYWSHAACLLPLEDWPAYEFKRRARRAKGKRWHTLADHETSCRQVVDRLRSEGPQTANELGGAKKGGEWWDWSETKIAAEWLLDTGDLVCRQRRGFQRVYDLAERAIPAALLDEQWSDERCALTLVDAAGRALGVATQSDLATYHGLPRKLVRHVMPSTDLTEVRVEGWPQVAYVAPGALDVLERRVRGRSTLISPFDSLMWFRERAERLFGIRHRLEAYTPKERRTYGHARPRRHHHGGAGRSRAPGRCTDGQAGHAADPRCSPTRGVGAEGGGHVGGESAHRTGSGRATSASIRTGGRLGRGVASPAGPWDRSTTCSTDRTP
jgi:hypothetical protein